MKNGDQAIYPIRDASYESEGLTKREYFAGLAMQGLIAKNGFASDDARILAECSIKQADALLAKLIEKI